MQLRLVCTYPTRDQSIAAKMEDFIDRHDAKPDIHEGQATFDIRIQKADQAEDILREFRQSLPSIFRPAQCIATITYDPIEITIR